MASPNKHLADCIRALEKLGVEVVGVDRNGNHPKLRCRYGDKEWTQVISNTVSSVRELKNLRSYARRQMKEDT